MPYLCRVCNFCPSISIGVMSVRAYAQHPPPFHYPLQPYHPPVFSDISLEKFLPVKTPVPKKILIKRRNYEHLECLIRPSTSDEKSIAIVQEETLANKVEEIMRTLNGRKITCTELKLQGIAGIFVQPFVHEYSRKTTVRQSSDAEFSTSLMPYSSPLPSHLLPQKILYFTESSGSPPNHATEGNSSGPSNQKLEYIAAVLESQLPKFLDAGQSISYDMYRENMVFADNIRNKIISGKTSYVQYLTVIKLLISTMTYSSKFEILNVNTVIENGTVRVRWRIVYKKYYDAVLSNKNDSWYDGFSVFHVDGEGFIFKHIVDKVMPDDGFAKNKRQSPVEKILRGAVVKPAST